MNFLSQITSPITYLMNKSSSVFMASGTIVGDLASGSGDNFFSRVVRALFQIAYFACKWIMYMIDVIYFYILQLAGVSADTSIFDSPNSDMTFNLLISNKEQITVIIKNLIAVAIVLILVTAIIAIIKQQSQAFKEQKAKKSPTGDVIRSVGKSLLLIILTPLIAILGIIASSVLLQSLFNATNLSDTKSLSARVFNASAASANKYKIYAENGVRIPIKYKFSGDNRADAINYTAQMVGNSKFPSILYFDENQTYNNEEFNDPVLSDNVIKKENYSSGTEAWKNDVYYTYYDTSEDYSPTASNGDQFKYYSAYLEEYNVMSEVVMYAMDTMEKYYFVTIQELLESIKDDEETFKSWIQGYQIKFYRNGAEITEDASGYRKALEALKNGNYDYIKYTVVYNKEVTHDYCHVRDAVDEMEGAKFIIAYKIEDNDEYKTSLNGTYYEDGGSYYEADTYYYKARSSSRYKKVDLYYYYDSDKGAYRKESTFDVDKEYYYKIGEDYKKIKDEDKNCFYYKDKDRNYVSLNYGSETTFYNAITKFHYAPLSKGIAVFNNPSFSSNYLTSGLITAKGIFDNSSYPTAIRRLSNGNILFYRDDLEIATDGSVSDVGTLDQVEAEEDEDEEEEEDKNVFQKIGSGIKSAFNSAKKFITGLFNPLKLVPNLNLDVSKVSTTYTSKTTEVHVLTDGELHLSYFFSDSLTSSLSEKMYGINLNCLYDPLQINYVILVLGALTFLKICVTAVFGLINRSLNLFIMIMIYPVACALIPYDEAMGQSKNGPYTRWSRKYTGLLFSTYGLILGINFIFLLLPVIDKIEFFTEENFLTNKALGRIGNALYNPWMIIGVGKKFEPNYNLIVTYVNKILRIIFQISAFSLVTSVNGKGGGETFASVIQNVVGTGPGALEGSPLDAVKKTLKTMANGFNLIFFPTKYIKNAVEKAKETATTTLAGAFPASAIITDGVSLYNEVKNDVKRKSAKTDLVDALKSNAPKNEVEEKLKAYKSAYGIK